MKTDIIFRQLFEKESSTYTYILGDTHTKEAVIIDPVLETVDRDVQMLTELGLELKYILETHVHADHVTGSSGIKKYFPVAQTVVGDKNVAVKCADKKVKEGETIEVGSIHIQVLETPGHTEGCVTYVSRDMVFTGDALLIRSCGRTDFQGGSAKSLYESLQKIFSLGEEISIYPAHDYRGIEVSTIAEEKQFNEMIGGGVSEGDFVEKMNNLKLDLPKKIHFAVPSNQICGKEVIGK